MVHILLLELKFLRRLKLEFDVNICDCGEKWKETDCAGYIKERIKNVENKEQII